MACCQIGDLNTPVEKQCVGGDNERAILLSDHCLESCINVSFAASL